MASGFNISAAWAGVVVATVIPGCTGLWYFASSQAKTETTVQMLDTRTAKMEQRIDAIATKLNVPQPAVATIPFAIGSASATPANAPLASAPSEHQQQPNVGAKAWP